MSSFKLSRRAMLRGVGGVAIALPTLEAMLDPLPAQAQNQLIPKRYLIAFHGGAIGCTSKPGNVYVPSTVGANYDLKTALAPLANHGGIKNEVTVVSGLKIPSAADNGGSIPPGGRRNGFHMSTASPLLTGVRTSSSTDAGQGVSSDWVAAETIGKGTPHRLLNFRVQVGAYRQTSLGTRSTISYQRDGSGRVTQVQPTVSPNQAFTSLFGNFVPPGTTTVVDPVADRAARARRSVLDLVRVDTERLMDRLGTADRQRLSRHFDEIRDLENRIAAIPPTVVSAATCVKPTLPADPTVGSVYSDEDARAKVFCDLIHLAFACDLSRSAALMFTMFQSFMNMSSPIGVNLDLHEIGHASNAQLCTTENVGKIIAWHTKHFGYLVSKFRDTPEGAGRMIDNVAAVMVSEAGHGRDPDSPGTLYSSHSSDNMVALVAGRAGGLKPGRHVVATGVHPGRVILTALNAVGANVSSFGEVTGDLPALYT